VWETAIQKYCRASRRQVFGRAESACIVGRFSRTICPLPLGTVKWQFFTIHSKKILPEKLAKRNEQIAETPNHRIIVSDSIAMLGDVDDQHHDHYGDAEPDRKHE